MEGIADEESGLKSAYFEHSRNGAHRFTGRSAFVLHQNGAVRNAVFTGVVSSHRRFTGRVAGTCAAGQNQEGRQVAVPQVEGMVEPRSEDGRRFAGVLCRTQNDDDLGGLRFIP